MGTSNKINSFLREAAISLPATMADIEVEHESVLQQVIDAFGGFTLIPGIGGWANGDGVNEIEPVVYVTIAMEPTIENHDKLETIVDAFGRRYNQKSMYVRYADGVVAIRPVVPVVSAETSNPAGAVLTV